MSVILEADGIVSGYGEVDILHGVSLIVEEGEIVSVIGPNGAGKSTLLKSCFGLLKLRKGKVLLDGVDKTNQPPQKMVKNGVSYVPQSENVFPSLTIVENLEMGAFIGKDNYKQRLGGDLRSLPGARGAADTSRRASFPAASDRCWRSRARSCSSHGSCSSTSRPQAFRRAWSATS